MFMEFAWIAWCWMEYARELDAQLLRADTDGMIDRRE